MATPTRNPLNQSASWARWFLVDNTQSPGNTEAMGVVLIDADTGLPYTASGGGGGGSAPSATEDAAAASSFTGSPILAVRNDSAAVLTDANGDFTAVATDSAGRVGVSDLGGSLSVDDNGSSLTVDGTVAATQSGSWTVSGTGTFLTGAEKVEDSAAVSGDTGLFVLAVRNDNLASLTNNPGDYSPIAVDNIGAVYVDQRGTTLIQTDAISNDIYVQTSSGALLANRAFGYLYNGSTWDRQRSGGVTGMTGVAGAEAHDAPITGNPVLIAGRASENVPPATSADGDVGRLWVNRNGRVRAIVDRPNISGIYYGTYTATVTAAADAATGGKLWFINPIGSGLLMAIRRITLQAAGIPLSAPTSPVYTIERVTFTGTASGATVTPGRRDSTDATFSGSLRTASTGLTLTAGSAMASYLIPTSVATSNYFPPAYTLSYPEDERIILRGGQGIVLRQSTAGTTSDTRTLSFDLIWEEFDTLANT